MASLLKGNWLPNSDKISQFLGKFLSLFCKIITFQEVMGRTFFLSEISARSNNNKKSDKLCLCDIFIHLVIFLTMSICLHITNSKYFTNLNLKANLRGAFWQICTFRFFPSWRETFCYFKILGKKSFRTKVGTFELTLYNLIFSDRLF